MRHFALIQDVCSDKNRMFEMGVCTGSRTVHCRNMSTVYLACTRLLPANMAGQN